MRLDSIKLFGFKSFAGKVSVKLGDGITGVLGPNGCGKSNIADAIRWVLGEQSAKHLRGSSMEDVIFKGTRDRAPLGVAEVFLHIKNDKGLMPIDYTDVSVGRRLYRSGQSEYLLNKTPCRLKDIRGLFLDSGLGVQAYSIFEREMIDEILNDNSTRRREMFEEASGIMKYKMRRKEALRKLDSSNRDLERVNDTISVIDREVRSLSRQVGRARRYRRLKQTYRDLDVAASARRVARIGERRRELERGLSDASGHETGFSAELRTGEAAVEALRLQLLELGDELSGARAGHAELKEQVAGRRQRVEVLVERREGLARSITELTGRAEEEGIRSVQLQREIEICERERTEAETVASERERSLEREESALAALESSLGEERRRLGDLQQLTLDLRERATRNQHELARERTRLEEMGLRRERLESDRLENLNRGASLRERLESRTRERREIDERVQASTAAIDALETDRKSCAEEIDHAREHLREVGRERATIASRLDTLEELRKSYEGYDQGVRTLLLSPPDGVIGALTELIETDASLSGALEAGLGDAMQAVVVRDGGVAERCLSQLSASEQGRATFCPVHEMSEMPPPRPTISGDCLADRVSPRDAAMAPVIEAILGRTFLAADAAEARARSREHAGTTWVTRAGEAFHEDRRVSGGSAAIGRRLIMRETEISRLEAEDARLARELAAQEEAVEALRARLTDLDERLGGAREDVTEVRAEQADAHEAVRRLEIELGLTEEEARGISSELESLAATVDAISQRIREWENVADRAEAEGAEHASEWDSVAARVEVLDADREAKLKVVGDLRVSFVQASAELQSCRARHERLVADRDASEASGGDFRRRIDEARIQTDEIASELAELESSLEGAGEAIETAGTKVDTLSAREADLRNQWGERDQVLQRLRRQVTEARDEMHKLELELSSLSGEGQRVRDHLFDEHRVVLLDETDDAGIPLIVRHERRRVVVERPDGSRETGAPVLNGSPAGAAAENGHAPSITDVVGRGTGEADGASPPAPDGTDTAGDVDDPTGEGPRTHEEVVVTDPMPADPPPAFRDRPEDEWVSELETVRDQVKNFGPVNEMAVEDYELKKERLDFLRGQHDDLIAARDALLETIRKVNREARERFMATFSLAKENFSRLHGILFPGGFAELKLEGDDPLEGDILMVARPKGKRVESIKLLSSGERALTALALIFAVYLIKPSPFCILDEVDAPLDDANIDRFVDLIREFSGKTQFIMITHNKRTMEACDALYGVTMQDPGVSKLVSVQLHDGSLHVDGQHAPEFITTG